MRTGRRRGGEGTGGRGVRGPGRGPEAGREEGWNWVGGEVGKRELGR